jgi:hypothetical protein
MVGETELLHSTSALDGAMIVGGASLSAAIYSQWYQARLQMMTYEANKREAIYGEFIMSASKVIVKAYISDNLSWTRDEQHLIGLINRMRLFAPAHVIAEADKVIRTLVEISLEPRVDLHELAQASLTDRTAPDLLLDFSLATLSDLENVTRVAGRKSSNAGLWRSIRSATSRGLIGSGNHRKQDRPPAFRNRRKTVCKRLEGIVSHKLDQPYWSGKNPGWIKVKTHSWREKNRDRGEMFKR